MGVAPGAAFAATPPRASTVSGAAPAISSLSTPSSAPASLPALAPPANLPVLGTPLPTRPIALKDAEAYALAHSPLLAIAAARTEEAAASLQEAQAARYPLAYGFGEYLYATGNNSPTAYLAYPGLARAGSNNVGPGGMLLDNWHTAYSNALAGLSAQLLLFDFGSAAARVRAAESSRRAAQDRQRFVEIDVLASTDQAYLALLAAHEAMQATTAALSRADEELRLADAGLAAGLRSEVDVARAKDEVAMAQLAVTRSAGQIEAAQESLAAVLGAPATPMPDTVAAGEVSLPAGGENGLLGQALANRPDVRALEQDIAAAAGLVSSLQRERLPAIDATGGASVRGQEVDRPFVNWDVGAVLSVPLFDPILSARIHEARARRQELDAERQDLRTQVQAEVVRALTDLRTAVSASAAAELHENAASETLRLARIRYRQGLGTWPELTEAEANKIDADFNLIKARYDEQRAAIDLRRAIGLTPREQQE